MYRRRHWSKTGVSEVVGTILILAMTVVLFSGIIIWVASFPTPQAGIRLDMNGNLIPLYKTDGSWNGVNITIEHRGGAPLPASRTQIFLQVTSSNGVTKASSLKTKGVANGIAYGINGPDADWDTGEVWTYTNHTILSTDTVTMTVVDRIQSLVLWSEQLQGPQGSLPPVFVSKWADRTPTTPTIDPAESCATFSLFAQVKDPDGDLKTNSVFVYLAFLYGTPDNHPPQQMFDDGASGGDQVKNDGIFTASYPWFKPPKDYQTLWDGGVVLFNATDFKGHRTNSRMTLSVSPGQCGSSGPHQNPGSGRPPNLNYNGLQGYAIFNGTEWDSQGFNATETRTFKESEQVVVVVGSAVLKDLFGRNDFMLYDPFSNVPLSPVVYGSNKAVTSLSIPSSHQAFSFLLFTNQYNVFIYRFELNNQTISSQCTSNGGLCFAKTPTRPPQYFFGSYPLNIDLIDFLNNRFTTSDTITITANDGTVRNYPVLQTFRDSGYAFPTNQFNSTDTIYVQILMKTVDGSPNTVLLGNVVIQDFNGGNQVFRGPLAGPPQHANPPICPVTGTCTYNQGTVITINNGKIAYRFAINLTQADQDPWVEGVQHYALRVLSVSDSDESYSLVLSSQLIITAPLFRLDMAIAFEDATNPAWGEHDVAFWYLDWNGVDKWTNGKFEPAYPKKVDYVSVIRMMDFNQDGKMDVVANLLYNGNNMIVYRQDSDQGGSIQWTKNTIDNPANTVTDCRPANLNRDTAPELVCGDAAGTLWYYVNDGTWTTPGITATKKTISTTLGVVNALDVGDFNGDGFTDIAVARAGGQVTWFANDGNGNFNTGTTINLNGDATNVAGLDAGNYNGDTSAAGFPYDDVFVGTAGGRIYRLHGSAGGLIQDAVLDTAVGAITSLKLGNVTSSGTNPLGQVGVVVGTVVKVYSAVNANTLQSTTPAAPAAITAFGMGDIDGNGHDDFMAGTNDGHIVYYHWTPSGWVAISIFHGLSGEPITTPFHDLDLGDYSKSQYGSR